MKYPALDITGADQELLESLVDDFSPTAAEQHDRGMTFFFADAPNRDAAGEAIARAWPAAAITRRDVDDEDWARRSQESLTPITVGRITVTPPWHAAAASLAARRRSVDLSPEPQPVGSRLGAPAQSRGAGLQAPGFALQPPSPSPAAPKPESVVIVITPSMGFGTGHHATTRLCLAALQAMDLTERVLLDVGTGSGVLAIAGRALGAREAIGIDYDADAIQAATENLDANPGIDRVRMVVGDLRTTPLAPADIVTANLTGALLVQSAALLLAALCPGGTLIVSGLLAHERADVAAAFAGSARLAWEAEEQGWVGLAFNSAARGAV